MKRKLTVWLGGWIIFFLRENSTHARKLADEWKRKAYDVILRLDKAEKKIDREKRAVEKSISRWRDAVAEFEAEMQVLRSQVETYEKAENALNNENELLREIVIPGLTDGIEELRQQVKANISLSVAKQVMAESGPRKEE